MPRWYTRFLPLSVKSVAWSAILVVLAISLLAIVGSLLDIPALKNVEPQSISMRTITALCLALCATELALLLNDRLRPRSHVLLHAPGILVAVVGLLTIVLYAFDLMAGRAARYALHFEKEQG